MNTKNNSQIDHNKEDTNLQRLYNEYHIKRVDYDFKRERLHIYFKDKNYFKFEAKRSISIKYAVPTNEAKEKFAYIDTLRWQDISAYVSIYCGFRSKYESVYRTPEITCCTSIKNSECKKTENSEFYKTLVLDFYSRFHTIIDFFDDAQKKYRAGEFRINSSNENNIPAFPLIESRFVFERVFGLYIGASKQIMCELNRKF
jgi:hypothetical protein